MDDETVARVAEAYCDALGVSTDATDDEIKAAYRRLSRLHHPDVSSDAVDKSGTTQQDLNDAKDFLIDRAEENHWRECVQGGGQRVRRAPPGAMPPEWGSVMEGLRRHSRRSADPEAPGRQASQDRHSPSPTQDNTAERAPEAEAHAENTGQRDETEAPLPSEWQQAVDILNAAVRQRRGARGRG